MTIKSAPRNVNRPIVIVDGTPFDYHKLNTALSQVANAPAGAEYVVTLSPESGLETKQDPQAKPE